MTTTQIADSTTRDEELTFPTLPRESYFDRQWFDDELDRIFSRQWLYAGHVSELPEVGDFFLREIGVESIIVSRGEDGLHALFNVCRHRGARICGEAHGHLKRFVCPYHRWSYALDGTLLATPTMVDLVERARYPLVSAHVDVWHGLIFVNLSRAEPEPVAAILAGADRGLAPLELEHAKVAHTATYQVHGNWKLALENYFECYHCPGSHPEFCRVYDLRASTSATLDPAGHPLAEYGSLPLRPGNRSLTLTGEPASRMLFGRIGPDQLPVSEGFTLRPTTGGLFWGDYGVVFDFQPISPLETCMRCVWLVAGTAVEGRDYERDDLIALWDITNRQDLPLCEMTQQGLLSSRYVPGPNSSEREPGIRDFRLTYMAMMQEGAPPAHVGS